jgi:hypothetical protein
MKGSNMKKLIYIVTLFTLIGPQGRLFGAGQSIVEGSDASQQEKLVAPGQEPVQSPSASIEQESVRKEDVVAEKPVMQEPMPEEPKPAEPKTEPTPAELPAEEPHDAHAEAVMK